MKIDTLHPGITRITLPLPGKKPGPVNVYLFRGKSDVTLLDTGIFLTAGYLGSALAQVGAGFRDLNRIVLTHGHVDHCGALRFIAGKHAGTIEVCAHPDEIESIETGAEAPLSAYRNFLRFTGTPFLYRIAIQTLFFWLHRLTRGYRVHRSLNHGDRITLGDYTGRIVATPGHTRGSISIYIEQERILFSGDHVLGHITPNALPMYDTSMPMPRRRSQEEYFRSLDTIRKLAPRTIYPSHGSAISNFDHLYDIYRHCFRQRQDALAAITKDHENLNVYQITRKLFPNLSKRAFALDLYLALSETYSHLQMLEADDRLHMEIKDDILIIG